MDKKFQVFVSSTYDDLKDERQAVVSAILEAGHIPAGMELFASGDKSQLETIKRWIGDSDVFMLILGGRYGSIEPDSGRSYIEVEYQHATQLEKPYFAAVMRDDYLDAKVNKDGRRVLETDHGTELRMFKGLVTSKICKSFSNVDQLKLIVFQSLLEIERNGKVVGWVRANSFPDPKPLVDQIGQLSKENSELRAELGLAKARQSSEERYNGYEFKELFDRLNGATIEPPSELAKAVGITPFDTVLSVLWTFRKNFCSGISVNMLQPTHRFWSWLITDFSAELTLYGLLETGTTGEGIGTMNTAKISPCGLLFLGRIDREEELKKLIQPLHLKQS